VKRCLVVQSVFVCLVFLGSPVTAAPILYDWLFTINGEIVDAFSGDPVTGSMDASGFDWDQGLGTITLSYEAAEPGACFFIFFFDHEIDETADLFWNEYGSFSGEPPEGLIWEIDEPGYTRGDIYDHVLGGWLENSCDLVQGSEDDVSMAIGWQRFLLAGESVFITLVLSEDTPSSGFTLAQIDADSSRAIYLTSTLETRAAPAPVAEPATLLLFGTGVILAETFTRKRRRSNG